MLCLSLLIVFVGNSSLNVAIPTLSRELHATESQLQWVVAIYSLVFAGLLFSTGALGDRFGRKGALQLGLAAASSSAPGLASLSTAMWQLIACRCVMGAAGALIMPSTLSIIVNVFPPHERPKAIAIWASVTGAAGALGPVASGFLLGHFWFGSVFLVNVPIIVARARRRARSSSRSRATPRRRSSTRSARCSRSSASSRSSTASSRRPSNGWVEPGDARPRSRSRSSCSALFVAWELHVDEPMLDMHYFRNPAFSTGTGGMILVFLVDVRRDVPHHAVLPARARLQPALGRAAPPADRARS